MEIIDGNMRVIEQLQNFMPRVIEGEHVGMVFNMAYGIQGESRYTHIPSMLEMLGIPYVGSGPSGHALALDKVITKIILQKHGLPTPEFWVFSNPDDSFNRIIYPVIVKPKMESVSFGLRIVDNECDLREAIDYIVKEFQQQALVERFIRGREFAVGLIGNNPVEAFPVLEIDLGNGPDAIQTVADKRENPMNKICPARIPSTLRDKMKLISIEAFKALQLRDFSRVDLRVDLEDHIYILEINSMASLGGTGSYVHAAGIAGYSYNMLVNKMLDVAAVRYFAHHISPSREVSDLKKKHVPVNVRIRGFLRSRQDTIEELLKKSVNINTYIRNVEGVNEMGNLAAIAALQSLRFVRLLKKMRIAILLTTDSSVQGRVAKSFIQRKAENAGYILALRGGDMSGSLVNSRSGSAVCRFNMHLQKTDDANMVALAASTFTRLVNAWCELSLDDNSLVIAPYKTSLTTNILQPYAHGEVILSVRFNDMDMYKTIDGKIRRLIPRRKFTNRILFQIEGGLRRPPMIETPQVQEFWNKVKEIARKLDILVVPEHRWSSSDICFIEGDKQMLDGFGPVGQKEHEKSEYILRHSLLERAVLIAVTLKEISIQ